MWQGLCESLSFSCKNCGHETKTFTSKKTTGNGNSPFDVTVRSTYASLPFGREGFAKFCGSMDLPPILSKRYYNNIKEMKVKSAELAENMMKETANRLIALRVADGVDIEIDSNGVQIACVPVTLDGT